METRTTSTPRKKSAKAATGAAPQAPGSQARLQPIQTLGLEAAEAQSRQILAARLACADGEFGARLPVTWSGTEGRIAEAFNQCIGNAQRITSEAARLSNTVGKE